MQEAGEYIDAALLQVQLSKKGVSCTGITTHWNRETGKCIVIIEGNEEAEASASDLAAAVV